VKRVVINDQDATGAIRAVAGMYQHHGLDVVIENPKGSIRRGVGPDGTPWATALAGDYGYIRRTVGEDDEPLDCFVGEAYDSPMVLVIRQVDPATREFDEHKVMLGYRDLDTAISSYLQSYSDNAWARIGDIRLLKMQDFKAHIGEF
jgi:hypothetical protein